MGRKAATKPKAVSAEQKQTNSAIKRVKQLQKASKIVTPEGVTLQNFMDHMEGEDYIENGLADALGLPGELSGTGYGVQLSQTDTLFKNTRWYLVTNFRSLLSQIYVEHGLIATIVDLPIDDALRGGIDIKTVQLKPEEIKELKAKMSEKNDLTHFAEFLKWNRLFGGSGLIITIDGQDCREALDISRINRETDIDFIATDLWELFSDLNYTADPNPFLKETELGYFTYYGEKIHRSNVMLARGKTAPSFIRPRLRGWGLSVVEDLIRSINQYLKTNNLTFEVLDEFKLDIFKIADLAATLSVEGGDQRIRQRIALANSQKSYQNALVMDANDDYDHKQLSFSGIADTMREIRMQVASDMRMPITKLFGVSATGFNSGEDDIENYNSMIESLIRTPAKHHLIKMVKIRCQQLFGFIPTDLEIEYEPLRVMSSEQEETVKTQVFSRLTIARQMKEITTKEFRDACNADNLLPIQLKDSEIAVLDQEAEEAMSMQFGAASGPDGEEASGNDEESDGGGESKPSFPPGDKSKLKTKLAKKPKPTRDVKNGIMNRILRRIE